MSGAPRLSDFAREQLDRVAIIELVQRERVARDMHQWPQMADCYAAASVVDISWFHGTGAEFTRASQKMAADGLKTFHQMGPTVVRIRGDRALADTGCAIHVLGRVDGVEVDVICHARMYTRVSKNDAAWLIAGVRVVYVKDMMSPLDPGRPPDLDSEKLATFPESYRFLSYMHWKMRGQAPRDDLPGMDRLASVHALLAAEDAWLMQDGES